MKQGLETLCFACILLIGTQAIVAQNNVENIIAVGETELLNKPVSAELYANCACCTEAYKAFDFWEGDWLVLDTLGKKVGDNTITKLEDNCLLKEKWRGSGGSTGTSVNFYNKADSTWNQIWVDNQGYVLRLQGGLVQESMVLKSELLQGRKQLYYNQITWTPNSDGTVTQLWEIYAEDGKLLRTLFKGIYQRKA